ncbi:apical junction molecule-like [Impatiens glandulifera]|uniref:apical junction molecule-like n=1 Tax=Impatiens glandulifera TaxID=253017 RepID=UPI001FB1558D|nr:apical junction molecule-like [Impatiens glandulifera]
MSERTESEKTDDERPNDEEHWGPSPDNTGTGANPENDEADEEGSEEEEEDDQTKADIIARRILEVIELRAQKVGELYREWHEHRFDRLYKHMLPGLTDEECFRRLKEIEETVISLTNAETIHEALGRTTIIRPRARLQKLTVRIRKIKERYVEGTPEANLHLLVLEKLETARGELVEEIDRLEVVCRQRKIPHSPTPQTDEGQIHGTTPPQADPVINETDERTEPTLTGQLQHEQPRVSELDITEERVKFLLQEFADSTRTEALEVKTSEVKDGLDRIERQTEQRLTEVTKDLVGSTIDKVSELEKKNAGLEDRNDKLEADLKALTAQVDELLKAKMNADIAVVEANARAAKEVQDALNEEARREKEPPQMSEAEIAERERRTAAKYPDIAKSIAVQAAKDAERLDNERQRLEDFATAHKKKKTATRTEDEDEEHLMERSTRQRVSESASQPQPVKRKRNKDMMANFDFSNSEQGFPFL